MPLKDHVAYLEYIRKWSRNKYHERGNYFKKKLARRYALNKYKKVENCSIKGCKNIGQRHHENYDEPLKIIWICKYHHDLLHEKINNLCQIKHCNRKHYGRGMCKLHWQRVRLGKIIS